MSTTRTWRRDGVSVVIPALNEEDAIAQTVRDVARVLHEASIERFQIIVVDDGSTDRTGEVACESGAHVVRHPHNVGYGRSLKRGISEASYDTIVITDADGTYPIERIPDLLDRYDEGFDMVVGKRTGPHLNHAAYKGWLRRVLKFLVEYSAGRKVPDVNSGLRVFSRARLMTYFPHLCDTFSFTTSSTLGYMMTGMFVTYVPIDYHERIGSTKVRLFRESMRTLQYIIQAIIYYNPLKLFLLLSWMCIGAAALVLLLALIFQVTTGFILGAGIILVALLVFALGLLADLLRQIMAQPGSRSGP